MIEIALVEPVAKEPHPNDYACPTEECHEHSDRPGTTAHNRGRDLVDPMCARAITLRHSRPRHEAATCPEARPSPHHEEHDHRWQHEREQQPAYERTPPPLPLLRSLQHGDDSSGIAVPAATVARPVIASATSRPLVVLRDQQSRWRSMQACGTSPIVVEVRTACPVRAAGSAWPATRSRCRACRWCPRPSTRRFRRSASRR